MSSSFLVETLILWRTSSTSFLEWCIGSTFFETLQVYSSFSCKTDSLAELKKKQKTKKQKTKLSSPPFSA